MNENQPELPAGIWKLTLLSGLCFVSFAIITPVLDELVRDRFGIRNNATTQFMAIHGIASWIFGIAAGVLSDRLGRRVPLIALGLVGSGVTLAAIPLIDDFTVLLVVRFCEGVFGAFALGLIMTRAIDLCGDANRSRTMGTMSIGIAGGFVSAQLMTAALAPISLSLLFALVGGALVLGGVWMMRDLGRSEDIQRLAGGGRAIFRALASNPRIALPLSFSFVDKFTFGTLAHMTSLAIKDQFGLGTQASALVLLGFWVAFSMFCLPGSRLNERFGSRKTLVFGSALYGICIMGLGVQSLPAFAVLMALSGAFCAIQYIPSITLVGEIAGPSLRGVSMGAWNTAGSMGVVAGLVLSGKLSEGGNYAMAYGVAGGLELAAALVAFVLLLASRGSGTADGPNAPELAR